MAANDVFANRVPLVIAGTIRSDNDKTFREIGEVGTLVSTVWYEWIAPSNEPAVFTLARTGGSWSEPHLWVWTESPIGVDDVTNLTLVRNDIAASGQYASKFSITPAIGQSYYFQIGSLATTPATGAFALTYPDGTDPAAFSNPGTNDLPGLGGGIIYSDSRVDLVEAVGYGPVSERVVGSLNLFGDDGHSDTTVQTVIPLIRNSDGSPSHSCERWIRLRFLPPFGVLTNVRMWIDNYDPHNGWELLWGLATDYQTPGRTSSSIAYDPIPVTDPVSGNLGLGLVTGDQAQYTPWIVIQARWLPGQSGPIQAAPLNWHIGWTEA